MHQASLASEEFAFGISIGKGTWLKGEFEGTNTVQYSNSIDGT